MMHFILINSQLSLRSSQHQTYQFALGWVHLHRLLARQSSFWDERRPLLKMTYINYIWIINFKNRWNEKQQLQFSLSTFSSLLVGMARWSRLRTSWTFLPFILVSTRLARRWSQAWRTQHHEQQHATPPPQKKTQHFAPQHLQDSHLSFNLYDSLLGQRARLNHTDALSGELCKDFLTTKTVQDVSLDEPSRCELMNELLVFRTRQI